MTSNNATPIAKLGSNSSIDGNTTVVLIFALLTIRGINALSIKTFFQPDEYFQSLEPAWQVAFGANNGAWITWEWREHLRSSTHPLLFAGVYKAAAQIASILRATPPARAEILIAAPKILQAVFAAGTDLFTYRLACKVYGSSKPTSRAALALTMLSPWQWFCSVRTLSNSLETTLTIIALDHWPWEWLFQSERTTAQQNGGIADIQKPKKKQPVSPISKAIPNRLYASLVAAAMACILRPTNLLVWATLSIALLWRIQSFRKFVILSQAAIVSGSAVLVVSIAMDQNFYGEWVFPPLRFLYFNVVQSLAMFYGRNRPDYYLSEGLFLLLTTAIPFAAVGTWQALFPRSDRMDASFEEIRIRFLLALSVTTSIIALSLIPHKEVRFIYPLLPMLHILAAKPLEAFFNPFPIPKRKYRLGVMVLGVALNLFIAYYTGYIHQRGIIDVMHYLRHEQETNFQLAPSAERNITVGFLMPCHSTPWRSHLVYPEINAWALTCEPPLGLSMAERENYLDEADMFYPDPVSWIDEKLEDRGTLVRHGQVDEGEQEGRRLRRAWPQYLVFFQQLETTMNEVLKGSRYQECWRGFNTHWHDDWRRQGDVIVWCMRNS